MTRSLLLLGSFLSAAAFAQPAVPGPRDQRPVGAIAPTCRLRAEIQGSVGKDAVRLRFVLVSTDPKPRVVKLTSACPGGVVQLTGLPAGFDPMHTCQRGACMSPASEQTVTVPARGRVPLGETVLQARGDACNPELPFGSTIVSAQINSDDPMDVCGGGTFHVVREPGTGRLRRAKPNEGVVATPTPTPVKPTPEPETKTAPRKECPVCAFGCLRGTPSTRVGPDGCTVCGCDDDGF